MTTQSFFVAGQLPGMNEIIAAAKGMGGRGLMYSLMKAEWTATISGIIVEAKIKPVTSYAFLTFVWQETSKRRDPDNIACGKKFVLDSLVNVGVLGGDGWRQVSGFEDYWRVNKENPGVLVEIKS